MTPVSLLAGVVVAWAAVATIFTLVTLAACASLARRIARRPRPMSWPRIVILRPCEGDEPGLHENLASSLARYDGERRVLVLVPSVRDASHAVACAVRDAASPGAVEVLVTNVVGVPNRKSAHLTHGLARALDSATPPEAVVQVDSDVRLDDDSLPSLLAALGTDPEVAAAFTVPAETSGRTAADLAASALLSASPQDFFALAALARISGGVVALAGTLAVHRTADLIATGGFSSLEGILGEDFEMGRRLMERGLRVEVAAGTVVGHGDGRSLREVWARTARWAMVVRRQRGRALMASYPLLLAPTPLLLLLSASLALAGEVVPLAMSTLLLASRTLLAAWLRRLHGMPVGPARAVVLALAGELLMLAAFPRAVSSNDVVWRGRRLRILAGGQIDPLDEHAQTGGGDSTQTVSGREIDRSME